MTALELVRVRWDVPHRGVERAARVATRVAGLGLTTFAAADRVRRIPGGAGRDGARERARVLRDASRRALDLHGVELVVNGRGRR